MEPQHGHDQGKDSLPGRIRKGHRHNCPGCEYTGKNLISHLERDHPDVRKRYEKSRRGVWVLVDDGGGDDEEGDESSGVQEREEPEEEESEKVESLREELRDKERRIAELEAQLNERERRIEDLREARDRLAEIAEEALGRLPESVDDGSEGAVLRLGDGGKADGGKETASREQAAKQIKMGLSEAFEERVEREEGRN